MRRKPLTISKLAADAGRPVGDVLALLENDFGVSGPSDILRDRQLLRAKGILGLHSPDSRLVSNLAKQANLEETEVRSILCKNGILRKRRLLRIPARLVTKAKRTLGISVRDAPAELITVTVPKPPPPPKKRRPRRKKSTWPTIGKTEDLIYISPSDVIAIHHILVDDFATSKDPIVPPGVRDRRLLESALFRPKTSYEGETKYPTVAMAGAALLHSIVQNHPFFNGNKRTALVSMLVFLDKNGWMFNLGQDEIYDFVIAIASHNLIQGTAADHKPSADDEVLEVSWWLQRNIRAIRRTEFPLKFRELRSILTNYGCEFETPKGAGNRVNIRRGNKRIQIAYKYEGNEVPRQTIHKVRNDLNLNEHSGYDSDIFYNKSPRIPQFINKYRKVLDRLAKV